MPFAPKLVKQLSKLSPAGRSLVLNASNTGQRTCLRPSAVPVYFEGYQLEGVWRGGHALHSLAATKPCVRAIPICASCVTPEQHAQELRQQEMNAELASVELLAQQLTPQRGLTSVDSA